MDKSDKPLHKRSAPEELYDEHNKRDDQKYMDKSSSDRKNDPSNKPDNKQNNKQTPQHCESRYRAGVNGI